MNKVYVVNFSGHKIHKAERYGEIKILTEGKANIFQTDRIMFDMAGKMKDVDIDDYILLSGTPILNVIAVAFALQKNSKVNLLLYDAKAMDYVVRSIKTSDMKATMREVKNERNVNATT